MNYQMTYEGYPFQGASIRLQNRVVFNSQALITQADVASWSVKVFDPSTRKMLKVLVDASSDATANFFDTLQTGNGWDRDGLGYNFEYVLKTSDFKCEGGKKYRIEFDVRTSNETIKWVWSISVAPWMGAP